VLDAEGYHAHPLERSDRPVSSMQKFSFPSSSTSSSSSGYPFGIHLNDFHIGSATPSPAHDMSQSQPQEPTHMEDLHVPPIHRAISEPPPDAEEHDGSSLENKASSSKLSLLVPTQEYSWEWGAFPQPSPMNSTFGRSRGRGRGKANMDASGMSPAGIIEESQEREHEHGRSHSVPPGVDGSPTKKRKHRELPEDHLEYDEPEQLSDLDEVLRGAGHVDAGLPSFGKGGRLKPSPTDPARFLLSIDGREIGFELSLMPYVEGMTNVEGSISDPEETGETEKVRGRRNRYGRPGGTQISGKLGDMEAARLFSLGKIDVHRLLDDDSIIDDPRLVVRWIDDQ
jgi:phosphatidate phosphatase LPIN